MTNLEFKVGSCSAVRKKCVNLGMLLHWLYLIPEAHAAKFFYSLFTTKVGRNCFQFFDDGNKKFFQDRGSFIIIPMCASQRLRNDGVQLLKFQHSVRG